MNKSNFNYKDDLYIFACVFGIDIHMIKKLNPKYIEDDICMMFIDNTYLHSINSCFGSVKMIHRLAKNYDPELGEKAVCDLFGCRILKKIKNTDLFYCSYNSRSKSDKELMKIFKSMHITSNDLKIKDNFMYVGRIKVYKKDLMKSNVMEAIKRMVASVKHDLPQYVIKAVNKCWHGSSRNIALKCMRMLRLHLQTNYKLIGIRKYIDNILKVLGIDGKEFDRFIRKTEVLEWDEDKDILYNVYLRKMNGQCVVVRKEDKEKAIRDCDSNFLFCILKKCKDDKEE